MFQSISLEDPSLNDRLQVVGIAPWLIYYKKHALNHMCSDFWDERGQVDRCPGTYLLNSKMVLANCPLNTICKMWMKSTTFKSKLMGTTVSRIVGNDMIRHTILLLWVVVFLCRIFALHYSLHLLIALEEFSWATPSQSVFVAFPLVLSEDKDKATLLVVDVAW